MTLHERAAKLRDALAARFPASDLRPVAAYRIERLRADHPDMPEHLAVLLAVVGEGCIGDSGYAVWELLAPGDVFDPITAAELSGVVLVGNDFGEHCEAYHTRAGWRFGTIGESCRFVPHDEYADFVEFLEAWVLS